MLPQKLKDDKPINMAVAILQEALWKIIFFYFLQGYLIHSVIEFKTSFPEIYIRGYIQVFPKRQFDSELR